MGGWMGGWMEEWMDGWVDGWVDGGMDGGMDRMGSTDVQQPIMSPPTHSSTDAQQPIMSPPTHISTDVQQPSMSPPTTAQQMRNSASPLRSLAYMQAATLPTLLPRVREGLAWHQLATGWHRLATAGNSCYDVHDGSFCVSTMASPRHAAYSRRQLMQPPWAPLEL
eukprot:365094-Chlamydomonas_euryale.AAC.10